MWWNPRLSTRTPITAEPTRTESQKKYHETRDNAPHRLFFSNSIREVQEPKPKRRSRRRRRPRPAVDVVYIRCLSRVSPLGAVAQALCLLRAQFQELYDGGTPSFLALGRVWCECVRTSELRTSQFARSLPPHLPTQSAKNDSE